MDYWLKITLAIVLLVAGIFLYFMLKEFLIAVFTRMDDIRFKRVVDNELDRDEQQFLSWCKSLLTPLGFKYEATLKHSFLESPKIWAAQYVFYHPEHRCHAVMMLDYEHIGLPGNPDLEQLLLTSFYTWFDTGYLVTHNGMMNIDADPDEICQWIRERDLAELFNRHKQKVDELSAEQAVRELSVQEVHAEIEAQYRKSVEALEAEGRIKRVNDTQWQTRPMSVFRSSKLVTIAKDEVGDEDQDKDKDQGKSERREAKDETNLASAQEAAAPEDNESSGVPLPVLVYFYRRTIAHKNLRNNRLGVVPRLILLIASALYFWLLTGMVYSWVLAPMLMLILFVHELGHFLAMAAFGYKNKGIVFVPIMGAATTGEKDNPHFYESLIVYLAGPVPGIVIALVLLAVIQPVTTVMLTVLLVTLFVNYVNLFPIPPMDGGRVLQLLSARWHALVGLVFGAIGLALLTWMMIKWNDYIILIFLIPLAFYVYGQLDMMNLHSLIRPVKLSMQKQHENDDLVAILERTREDKAYEDLAAHDHLERVDAAYRILKTRHPVGIQWWVGALVYIACLVLPVYAVFQLYGDYLARIFRFW